MKYVYALALVGALSCLSGCVSASKVVVVEPVGPGPSGAAPGTGDGSLVIYSARTPTDADVYMSEWRWNNDFGKNEFLYESAHTDYVIYAENGEIFKPVRNSRNANDGMPTVVHLPAGTYRVEAEAVNCDSDRVKVVLTVVIQHGRATLAHLDDDWRPQGQFRSSEVAKLPCGRIIGWRAPEAELAHNPTLSPN
ncbi:MAG: hypothetical protein NT154_08545 [Verrucomicrobia bacterium]|nr:hypothetical protein [Verrucomicrobiota bacterium]